VFAYYYNYDYEKISFTFVTFYCRFIRSSFTLMGERFRTLEAVRQKKIKWEIRCKNILSSRKTMIKGLCNSYIEIHKLQSLGR
jgi:hypothetical protein